MLRRLRILIAALSLLALLGGCGRPAAPPTVVPPAAAPVAGYEGAGTDLSGLDLAPLRGRRILLDPGHGGRFRGALGPNGLSEAEVNLGVALYLRGLLEWAGAEVFLTRSADVDLSTPVDSTLAGDLARRVALADSLRPDVFLSLHHNSNATRDPIMNETQTYYPAGREGADLDLARAIHRHMVRALGISPARIMAGRLPRAAQRARARGARRAGDAQQSRDRGTTHARPQPRDRGARLLPRATGVLRGRGAAVDDDGA